MSSNNDTPTATAEALTSRDAQTSAEAEQVQIVTFEVGQEEFAVDILAVQEIIRVGQITRVPQSPPSVEGAVNFRGQITPVVNLRRRFGIEAIELGKDARIVIIEIHNRIVGFLVDRVHEVLRIDGSTVDPAPTLGNTVDADYVRGVAKLDDHLIILLELERLFGHQDLAAADDMPNPAD